MDGRAFLDVADELAAGASEAHWRAAAGRAYYALMQEGRDTLHRWGFPVPPRDNVHTFVRLRFTYAAHADLRQIGDVLEQLARLRNYADYQLANPGPFSSSGRVVQSVRDARDAIVLLDAIDTDSTRQASAIAAIRAAFP